MIRFLRALEGALLWLGRFRLLRPFAVLLALVWALDGFVRVATDAAWFASLGQEKLWRAQMAWQIGLAGAFGLLALGTSVALMRAVARPAGAQVEPPLPRALRGWARARTRATRWGWALLVLGVGTIGRDLSERWPAFALSGAGASKGGGSWSEAGADFWVWHAPALAAGLDALWRLGLLLGLVAVGVGGLRSLPFLAARQSIAPRRWLRTLGTVSLALLTRRPYGFASEAARAVWNLSNRSETARFCEFALCIAGVLGCFACALSLRRPRPKLALLLGLGVGLPALLSDALAPRGLLSTLPDARATGETPRALSPIALQRVAGSSGVSSPVRLERVSYHSRPVEIEQDGLRAVLWPLPAFGHPPHLVERDEPFGARRSESARSALQAASPPFIRSTKAVSRPSLRSGEGGPRPGGATTPRVSRLALCALSHSNAADMTSHVPTNAGAVQYALRENALSVTQRDEAPMLRKGWHFADANDALAGAAHFNTIQASVGSAQPGEGPPADVPVWDEATLLRVERGRLEPKQNGFVEWESVGVRAGSDGQSAQIVGQAPLTDAWAGHGLTGEGSELTWSSLDLPGLSRSQHQPLGPLYYGLDARPLLSDDARSGGVPLESWAWKLAWAWRLRDPLLLIEGAREKRLLTFRGARECGQKIAPFWLWDEAAPRRDPHTGSAVFECVAYAATPDLPDASPFSEGLFAGQNAVRPVAVLRMDGRDGRIQIAPFAASPEVPDRQSEGNPFAARWARSLPSLFDAPTQNAPTPALEAARAGELPPVWTPASGGWEQRAVPPTLQGAVSQKLGDFAREMRSRSTAGSGALEGATPSLWKRGAKTFLARPYFALAPDNAAPIPTGQTPASDGQTPGFRGFLVGQLGSASLGWGHTLEAAYMAAFSSASPETPRSSPALSPPKTPSAPPSSTREAARQAIAAWSAAREAFKAGRYVESEQQSERARQLLEPLAR